MRPGVGAVGRPGHPYAADPGEARRCRLGHRGRVRNRHPAVCGEGGRGREGGGNESPGRDGARRMKPSCQSGMTAVASISTSQSGRASAVTTTPVDTGWTPRM